MADRDLQELIKTAQQLVHPLILLAGLFLASPAFCHIEPVFPVWLTIKVYDNQAIVKLEAAGLNWGFLGPKIPPSVWPENMRKTAKDYIAGHLILKLDGRPLDFEILDNRFAEEPWGGEEEGHVVLHLKYSFPQTTGRTLSGRATFYEDDYRPPDQRPSYLPMDFVTYVEFLGRSGRRFSVPYEKPDFEIPIEEARRTFLQRCSENFVQGLGFPLAQPSTLLFIAAAIFALPKRETVLRAIPIFAGLLSICFLLKLHLPPLILTAGLPVFVTLMAIFGALKLGDLPWKILLIASSPAWSASIYQHAVNPVLAAPSSIFRVCSLLGAFSSAAAAVYLLLCALRLYYRHLLHDSESFAESFMIEHLRFAETSVAAFGIYRFIHVIRSFS